MTPGSIEFRKHLNRVLPLKGGEQKAQYIRRIARHFGITQSRMTALYYDSREGNTRFTATEYQSIFGQTVRKIQTTSIHEEIQALRIKLEEKDQSLKTLEKKIHAQGEINRKLGKYLIESTL